MWEIERDEQQGGQRVSRMSYWTMVMWIPTHHRAMKVWKKWYELRLGEPDHQQLLPHGNGSRHVWLNMVNLKPSYLVNLEVDSMKEFILEYSVRYSQKFSEKS